MTLGRYDRRESGPSAPPKSQPQFPRPPQSSPPAMPVPTYSPDPRVIRSYRDLDAPEDEPSSSSSFNNLHPSSGFAHSSTSHSRQFSYQGGGQQNMLDNDFSNGVYGRPLTADTQYLESRTGMHISRPGDPQQSRFSPSLHGDEDSWKSSNPNAAGRQFSYRRGSQKNMVDQDASNRIHGRPLTMDTRYPEPRTKIHISRPQGLHQAQLPLHADEDSWRNSNRATGRPFLSSSRPSPKKKVLRTTNFPSDLMASSSGHLNAENNVSKNTSTAAPKRTRSPPLSASHLFQEKSFSTEDVTERELEAKAKRLARFKTELSDPIQNVSNFTTKNDHPKLEKRGFAADSVEPAGYFPVDVDDEAPKQPSVIVGLCPDMCPEPEREERERKGDLDRYERLDGDRNQSSKGLAVKKYNRTAEREAELIRPLPILQKTMDYLLSLLDQPYDDGFLRLYNFLWDRMRAIRMDLRMQHIFNLEAVTMLEQMIRLHILAMHELCEYTKGEGFSEGFDAHLNIEQMNKTSVELFQIYDDYRKRGVYLPSEKEFRGYYALLKLDKHPGYKVEPAELSLDLAKMTPEVRQAKEVLFARDVARSCRTSNFIAFFRHGVKASYLQSCLMHAHFSKLRTQALASLHSGLLNSQGLPVSHVSKWLSLENEDVESLLEYHGFSIKEYEELYMVKEGPFINIDKDYPTKCSELVHSKRSKSILDDVLYPHQPSSILPQTSNEHEPIDISGDKYVAEQSMRGGNSLTVTDEEMIPVNGIPSPKPGTPLQHPFKRSRSKRLDPDGHPGVLDSSSKVGLQVETVSHVLQNQQDRPYQEQTGEKRFQPWNFSLPMSFPETQQLSFAKTTAPTFELPAPTAPKLDVPSGLQQKPLVIMNENAKQDPPVDSAVVPVHHDMATGESNVAAGNALDVCEEEVIADRHTQEVAKAKLKLFLRLWRRRCSSKRKRRQQNRLAANAALSSLSVGPPVQRRLDRPTSHERFNIDEIMDKRYKNHEESWSRLNVSDLVSDVLCERNPHSSCICWKVILCYGTHDERGNFGKVDHTTCSPAEHWLHSKLIPHSEDEFSDDLVVSSPGLTIWRKWTAERSRTTCCLSILKNASFRNIGVDTAGTNGALFLLSDNTALETQKIRLHSLVASLPCGSSTPLLILSSLSKEEFSNKSSLIFDKLGLHNLDKSRISTFLIVHLYERQDVRKHDGYFSDKRLREALKWLATSSLPQPLLCSIKTRELVLSHLNSSLDALNPLAVHKVGPNQCISAFNEAIDKSAEDILAAKSANPIGWPCPELSLLHNADEYCVLKRLVPSVGWSSAETIEPQLSALKHCRLPAFQDDTLFLNRGCKESNELEEQRLHLQDCLISYLNQSSKMMNLTMSMKEANIMLQKSVRLELHNTTFYVVPNWVLIFRRVFNWQLNKLASKKSATAYVLEKHDPFSETHEKSRLLAVESWPSNAAHPSLDEMLDASQIISVPSQILRPQPQAVELVSATDPSIHGDLGEITETSPSDLQKQSLQTQFVDDSHVPLGGDMEGSSGSVILPPTAAREADRLTMLLEQCNMVQNKIADKLSLYF